MVNALSINEFILASREPRQESIDILRGAYETLSANKGEYSFYARDALQRLISIAVLLDANEAERSKRIYQEILDSAGEQDRQLCAETDRPDADRTENRNL